MLFFVLGHCSVAEVDGRATGLASKEHVSSGLREELCYAACTSRCLATCIRCARQEAARAEAEKAEAERLEAETAAAGDTDSTVSCGLCPSIYLVAEDRSVSGVRELSCDHSLFSTFSISGVVLVEMLLGRTFSG